MNAAKEWVSLILGPEWGYINRGELAGYLEKQEAELIEWRSGRKTRQPKGGKHGRVRG